MDEPRANQAPLVGNTGDGSGPPRSSPSTGRKNGGPRARADDARHVGPLAHARLPRPVLPLALPSRVRDSPDPARTGRSIVGDHIGRFTAGHLVLVGSNLPHDWIGDVGDGEHITNRDVVFQFHPQWIRDCQQLLPELRTVDPLLDRAARGIEFTGPTAAAATPQLLAIGDSAGIDRLQHILALLDILSAAPPGEAQLLASPWIPPLDKGGTDDLIDDALNYLFTNSAREIRLADVAARAAMSESSFSRYFRRSAGQSFSDTVRKLRLAHACQLLENTDEPISTICHRTGYQNLSNFNRQFRREYGITPGQYRRINQQPEVVLAGSNPAQP